MNSKYEIVNNKRVLKSKRRRTPDTFELNIHVLDKKHYRLVQNNDDESKYTLYVSPIIQTSLNEITRGRTSFHNEQKLMILTRTIKERMSTQVRSIIKKSINESKLTYVNDDKMFRVDIDIIKKDDKYEIINPNKKC